MSCAPAIVCLGADDRPARSAGVRLTENTTLPATGSLALYKIETRAATYHLEKSGAGFASIIDRDGHDWIGFRPQPGTRAAGEFRGFPNAVNRQVGSYFHPKNQGTDPSSMQVEHAGPDHVSISATSSNQQWACRYEFFAAHCMFTMTKMPTDSRYWVLYEGTPGGSYDDSDWWMTSAVKEPQPMTTNHEGDIPAPEWIAFGDRQLRRVLFLLNHEDDDRPDRFYQMERQMTVFGFGRMRGEKHFASVPRRFSIGFLETTDHAVIDRAMRKLLEQP
ncbi:MAG: hypothetical protein ACREH8_05265 [Opitutaceae bacterium]